MRAEIRGRCLVCGGAVLADDDSGWKGTYCGARPGRLLCIQCGREPGAVGHPPAAPAVALAYGNAVPAWLAGRCMSVVDGDLACVQLTLALEGR